MRLDRTNSRGRLFEFVIVPLFLFENLFLVHRIFLPSAEWRLRMTPTAQTPIGNLRRHRRLELIVFLLVNDFGLPWMSSFPQRAFSIGRQFGHGDGFGSQTSVIRGREFGSPRGRGARILTGSVGTSVGGARSLDVMNVESLRGLKRKKVECFWNKI